MKKALTKQQIELLGALLLIVIFVAPFLSFASSRKDIYVDNSKIGAEDGTQARPYHTISEALVHANDRTDVHVAKGTYEDNIEIPKGVKIFGSDTDEVIVRAKSSRKVVISMSDNTEIDKLTIEKGKEGVWIKKDAKASIIKCVIRDNDKDGVRIGSGSNSKNENPVTISESTIKENGRTGIFSQKRRLVLMDNEITNNDSDGADLAPETSAWIEGNKFADNDGSGMKLRLDGSDVWTKSNTYRDNGHSGLEINAFGGQGRIDVNKSKFLENKNYGVARVDRGIFSNTVWNGFTSQSNTTFEITKQGTISPIIRVQ